MQAIYFPDGGKADETNLSECSTLSTSPLIDKGHIPSYFVV